MKIAKGASVRMEYELKVKGGDVIETSAKKGPLTYIQGDGKMLPGLEKQLEGLEPGAEKKGEIPAAQAFGTEESLPTTEMPRTSFPPKEKLKPGRVFEAKGPGGAPVSFKIITVADDKVTVRFLHGLVGRDIEYKVKVLAVEDPKIAPPLPPGVAKIDLEEIKDG